YIHTHSLHDALPISDIYTQKENSMGEEDYAREKMVILGDEAHHYSASTKSERETEKSWENAISTILNANEDNRLLEFTATIDLRSEEHTSELQSRFD